MKKFFVFCFTFAFIEYAQLIVQKDAEIEQLVKEVSADFLKVFIDGLVFWHNKYAQLSKPCACTGGA